MCLRRFRRGDGLSEAAKKPSDLESVLFVTAYRQNSHPFFGVRLARCYKEIGVRDEALKVFEEMKQSKIEVPDIWLILALGYMYYKKFELAKECLDEAEKMDDSSSVLQHYKGLYYLKGFKNIKVNFKKSYFFNCILFD